MYNFRVKKCLLYKCTSITIFPFVVLQKFEHSNVWSLLNFETKRWFNYKFIRCFPLHVIQQGQILQLDPLTVCLTYFQRYNCTNSSLPTTSSLHGCHSEVPKTLVNISSSWTKFHFILFSPRREERQFYSVSNTLFFVALAYFYGFSKEPDF